MLGRHSTRRARQNATRQPRAHALPEGEAIAKKQVVTVGGGFRGLRAAHALSQKLAQDAAFSNIHDPNVNVFFGGLMGRFNVL